MALSPTMNIAMGPTALVDDLALGLDPARFMQACGMVPDAWQAAVVRSMAAKNSPNTLAGRISLGLSTGRCSRL